MKAYCFVMITLFPSIVWGQSERREGEDYELKENISYLVEQNASNDYRKKRCKLDFYYPKRGLAYPTVVWFHGGGLRSGNKSIPKQLKNRGVAVVAPNYRLFPKAKCPDYVEDAAAAVAPPSAAARPSPHTARAPPSKEANFSGGSLASDVERGKGDSSLSAMDKGVG